MCVCIAGDANEVTRLKDEVEKLKRILAEKDKQIASLQETIKSKKAAGAAAQVLRYGGFVSRCMYVRTVCSMCVCMYVWVIVQTSSCFTPHRRLSPRGESQIPL